MIKALRAWLCSFLALAVFVSGCTPLVPYKTPPPGTSLIERQKIYDDKKVTGGFRIGNRRTLIRPRHLISWNPIVATMADYYSASGDVAAAERARKANAYSVAGLTLLIGGVVAYTLFDPVVRKDFMDGGRRVELFVGAVGISTIITWGMTRHLDPAAASFNDYLKKDLGLDEGADK